MVNILNARTKAERVYYYDPISERGSKKFAFSAVRLENPSPYTLDSGPVTVYAGQQFLGEGLCEPILPGSAAFIPYALDRSILAETDLSTREEIDRLLTIQTQQIRKTKLELTNRGSKSAKVYVRHQVQPGYELRKSSQPNVTFEKLGGAYLFPVTVAAGETVQLVIEEQSPIQKTVDIRTPQGVGAIALYLKKGSVDAKLRALLDEVVKTHTRMANLDERIQVLDEQMGVYRTRVDEINVQLVSLRQVRQATKLRQHLAAKMEEISDKLQDATMKLTNLRGERMALRIELQDKIAELTLKKKAERGTPDLPPSKQAGEDKAAPVARK
jgi:hypothetical protein